MSFTFGQFAASNFLAPATPLVLYSAETHFTYIRVTNNSPYQISLNLTGIPVVIPEFFIQDIQVPNYWGGNITIISSVNISTVSHSQSNSLMVEGYYASEVQSPLSQAIPSQAVTATASGKPIFSATYGNGATAGFRQAVNIFNPSNSGVTFTFHSAEAFTNETTIPTANLMYLTGGDLNLPIAIAPVSHSGTAIPPVSFAHCTAMDQNAGNSFTSLIEVQQLQTQNTVDLLNFPDSYTLSPGGNLRIEIISSAAAHNVRVTLKWSEDIAVAPQGGVLSGMAITTLVNQGNPAPTPVVTASPSGDGATATLINNDGSATFGDTLHPGNVKISGTETIGDTTNAGKLAIVSSAGNIDIDLEPGFVTVNGQTSGHADLYEYMRGTIKKVIIHLVNYKNTGNQNLVLPVAFTDRAAIHVFETQGGRVVPLASSVAQNIKVVSTAGNPGTQTTQAFIAQWSFGQIDAAFDTIQLQLNTGAANGVVIIEGF